MSPLTLIVCKEQLQYSANILLILQSKEERKLCWFETVNYCFKGWNYGGCSYLIWLAQTAVIKVLQSKFTSKASLHSGGNTQASVKGIRCIPNKRYSDFWEVNKFKKKKNSLSCISIIEPTHWRTTLHVTEHRVAANSQWDCWYDQVNKE